MAAIIIPAYNEVLRIGAVLRAVTRSKYAREVIVVNDASEDATAEIARRIPGVRVLEHRVNVGKGGALATGVAACNADLIAFVDADLEGLRPEHVDMILEPLLDGRCDMCIGVFRGGKFWSDSAQRVAPLISGQRAMRREFFEGVPGISDMRMGVEVALNTHAKRCKARIVRVCLPGVSHPSKEQKLGLVKGAAARARMYADIGRTVVKLRAPRKRTVRKRKDFTGL